MKSVPIKMALQMNRHQSSSFLVVTILILCCSCCLSVVPVESSSAVGQGDTSPGQEVSTDEGVLLQEHVKLLEKQLTALTMRRREDYQLLENNLKKFLLESAREFSDIDIQTELQSLK